MIHIIEIREILPSKKADTVKFKSTANLTYNCNKPEFNGHWAVGEKYKIDFNISSFQGSRGPVEMKWVNNARFWKDGDGPVDPPEKPVYKGGGGSYGSNSGGSMKKDYDSETSKRQTAANVAGNIMSKVVEAGGLDLDKFAIVYPVVADIVLSFLNGGAAKSADTSGMDSTGPEEAGGVPDEDFGF